MTPERLNELEALCDAATPGPWFEWFALNEREGDISTTEDGKDDGYAVVVGTWFQGDQDRAFIAAARTALPELIARVRELSKAAEHVVAAWYSPLHIAPPMTITDAVDQLREALSQNARPMT